MGGTPEIAAIIRFKTYPIGLLMTTDLACCNKITLKVFYNDHIILDYEIAIVLQFGTFCRT